MDLGAGILQTFRYVTFPPCARRCSPAACSLSRCPSTRSSSRRSPPGRACQTLPIWIFSNLARPNQAPVVNVVAALLIVLSVVPVWLAQRVSADTAGGRL